MINIFKIFGVSFLWLVMLSSYNFSQEISDDKDSVNIAVNRFLVWAQACSKGKNFPTLLSGKKGIYSSVSSNATWASGHADLLKINTTCVDNCHFGGARISHIDVWELN